MRIDYKDFSPLRQHYRSKRVLILLCGVMPIIMYSCFGCTSTLFCPALERGQKACSNFPLEGGAHKKQCIYIYVYTYYFVYTHLLTYMRNVYINIYTYIYMYMYAYMYIANKPPHGSGQGHGSEQSPQISSSTGRLGRRASENGGENSDAGLRWNVLEFAYANMRS